MPAMIALPDTVIDQLAERAAVLQLSADELAVRLIRDGWHREQCRTNRKRPDCS